ncbi:hypothetical protein HMPREF1557_01635 [Streptococcus sobrinus W1703]|uniref:Uncharacterized protein n=1 Tax=Streptococcus sobrinus W1703 TaxID=1227275 RepID=U2KHW9_9STRE|nr:hypothetical protein HMPREF1557_01635 [Streptococcus sobrinus W1703]
MPFCLFPDGSAAESYIKISPLKNKIKIDCLTASFLAGFQPVFSWLLLSFFCKFQVFY